MATTGAGLDALAERVNKVSDGLERLVNSGNAQVIVHRTEGPGVITACLFAAAIVACFATWAGIVVLHQQTAADSKRHDDTERDLQAWQQQMRRDLDKLKAKDEIRK